MCPLKRREPSSNVIGTTAKYTDVKNYSLPYGRMFTEGEDESRQRTAVLGATVPRMVGGNPAGLINQALMIRGIPFEVIGVLGEKGSAGGFGKPDEQIIIPLQTARYRVFGSNRIRSFSIQMAEGVPIEQGMVDLERVLRREHKIRPGGENDFTIRNQQDILATQQQATEVFTSLLVSIAAVSLLVGGRPLLRDLSGPARRQPGSDRGPAIRIGTGGGLSALVW